MPVPCYMRLTLDVSYFHLLGRHSDLEEKLRKDNQQRQELELQLTLAEVIIKTGEIFHPNKRLPAKNPNVFLVKIGTSLVEFWVLFL